MDLWESLNSERRGKAWEGFGDYDNAYLDYGYGYLISES